MERFQSKRTALQNEESNPKPCPLSQNAGAEVHLTRQLLGYAKKLFPVNVLVNIMGRKGIYRIVSEPYIPPGYTYPHFDVEALGEKFCTSVFDAARI